MCGSSLVWQLSAQRSILTRIPSLGSIALAASPHTSAAAAKAECLLVDLCDRLLFRGIRGVWDPHPSNSTAGVSQAHWEGPRDQARLAEAGPAGGTKEWSPSCLLPAFLPERLWLPPQCQALEQARCAQRLSAVGPDSVPSDLLFPSMADAVMVSPAEYKA